MYIFLCLSFIHYMSEFPCCCVQQKFSISFYCMVWLSVIWVHHNSFISSIDGRLYCLRLLAVVEMLVKNVLVISFGNCIYLFQVGYIPSGSTGVEGLLMLSCSRCCQAVSPGSCPSWCSHQQLTRGPVAYWH